MSNTGYSAETSTDRVVPASGQWDTIWTPRIPRRGTCGLILLPGSGNPRAYMDTVNQPASVKLAAAVASFGIPTITCDFYGNSWSNANAMTAITSAWTVLKAAFPLMRTDKVCLLGGSMGGGAVARWSQLNPTNTAAVVGLIPAYDTKYEYDNVAALVTPIETAWGFTGVGNFPSAANNLANVTPAIGIPILTYYAGNDTTVPSAGVTGYHTAAGGTGGNITNVGNLGHTDAAIAAAPISSIRDFLVANGA